MWQMEKQGDAYDTTNLSSPGSVRCGRHVGKPFSCRHTAAPLPKGDLRRYLWMVSFIDEASVSVTCTMVVNNLWEIREEMAGVWYGPLGTFLP